MKKKFIFLIAVFMATLTTNPTVAQNFPQPQRNALMSEFTGSARVTPTMQIRGRFAQADGIALPDVEQLKAPKSRAAGSTGALLDSVVVKNADGSNRSLEKCAYDSNGNPTLFEHYIWDSDENEWEDEFKAVYAYDSNGNLTLEEYSRWDSDKNEWKKEFKAVLAYDANGNHTFSEFYTWDSDKNEWENDYKRVYAYDSNGRQTLEYRWDSDKNSWIEYEKIVYVYDANGNRTLYEQYTWDSDINGWKKNSGSKNIYEYDSNSNRTLEEEYRWDSDKNEWAGRYKYVFAYNSNGNRTLYELYTWDSTKSDWVLSTIWTYYYSEHGTVWHINAGEAQIDNAPEMRCWVSGGVLSVIPAVDGVVTVYTSTGSVAVAVVANQGQQIELALPTHGVYIVKTADATAKVVW